jgi:hypothetical protein
MLARVADSIKLTLTEEREITGTDLFARGLVTENQAATIPCTRQAGNSLPAAGSSIHPQASNPSSLPASHR